MFQSSHISRSVCVVLKSPSGAGIPFLSSSGHSWFIGAALDVTPWGSPAVPQCREDCEASGCSEGDLGRGWGGLVPLETCHFSTGTTCLQTLASLSLYFNLRRGCWGVMSMNNLIALIFYPNCRGVRGTRLRK